MPGIDHKDFSWNGRDGLGYRGAGLLRPTHLRCSTRGGESFWVNCFLYYSRSGTINKYFDYTQAAAAQKQQ